MVSVGAMLQLVVKARKKVLDKKVVNHFAEQEKVLKKLLKTARKTQFGRYYQFKRLLKSPLPSQTFRQEVPVFDYQKMHDAWWHETLNGAENVSWPGKIKFFALTSGTSGSPSKRVPVTEDMIEAMQRTSKRQILTMADLDLPHDFYQKRILMLNGSSTLSKVKSHYEGDLSGILAANLPLWFHKFYKPGKKISDIKDWNTKLNEMVRQAKNWDVGIIAGVPAWAQLLLSKIIAHYHLKHIHEIWPNFRIFVHGGVSLEPYKKSFSDLLGREIIYLETYLASEGFMAYEPQAGSGNMRLVTNNGIYFEFIPFNDQNFTPDGNLVEHPETLTLAEVKEGADYALLISTCAGVWRYLIGDTIRFTNVPRAEMIITGRTKHFLSLCGEHLSVDNMTRAISMTADHFNVRIREFTVAGFAEDIFFAHKWFLGTDNVQLSPEEVKQYLDQCLVSLNDDYATERKAALKNMYLELLPVNCFYDFMQAQGKMGAQNKFPRVLNRQLYQQWEQFLDQQEGLIGRIKDQSKGVM
jgi:hypothetical protein